MSEEALRKLTVAAAAQAAGVPERSLFRAVEQGKVPSSKRDGVTVVDPADVEAWSARRAVAQGAAGSATPAAGTPQNAPTAAAMAGSLQAAHAALAVGSGRGIRPFLDGELTALLIGRFKRGENPVDVAEALRLPIPIVMEGHDHYTRAKAAAAPSPQQAKLEELQMELDVVKADINGLVTAITSLQNGVAGLATRIANMPTPERGDFVCECGNTGWVAVHLQCTVCKKNKTWGFHPPRQ